MEAQETGKRPRTKRGYSKNKEYIMVYVELETAQAIKQLVASLNEDARTTHSESSVANNILSNYFGIAVSNVPILPNLPNPTIQVETGANGGDRPSIPTNSKRIEDLEREVATLKAMVKAINMRQVAA